MENSSSKNYVLKRLPEESAPPTLSRNYAEELNGQQLAAVEAVDGPALVIAGAGSGKTRTLVYRVRHRGLICPANGRQGGRQGRWPR